MWVKLYYQLSIPRHEERRSSHNQEQRLYQYQPNPLLAIPKGPINLLKCAFPTEAVAIETIPGVCLKHNQLISKIYFAKKWAKAYSSEEQQIDSIYLLNPERAVSDKAILTKLTP